MPVIERRMSLRQKFPWIAYEIFSAMRINWVYLLPRNLSPEEFIQRCYSKSGVLGLYPCGASNGFQLLFSFERKPVLDFPYLISLTCPSSPVFPSNWSVNTNSRTLSAASILTSVLVLTPPQSHCWPWRVQITSLSFSFFSCKLNRWMRWWPGYFMNSTILLFCE